MTRRLAGMALALAAVSACTTTALTDTGVVVEGDPSAGRRVVLEHGCASCHGIPGLDRPLGHVGPPLGDFARRRVVAGRLPNTPENAAAWIRDPQAIDPATLMPDLGLTEQEARDVVAYLYSLE